MSQMNRHFLDAIESITPDIGGPVQPDINANIFLVGTMDEIEVTGDPGTHTLTLSLGDSVATTYTEDGATIATPQLNNLNIFGGTGITTNGAAATVTISTNGTMNLNYVGTAVTPYVVQPLDAYIGVDSTTGPKTVQLPDIPTTGRVYAIKDSAGTAVANNITITSQSGLILIDGLNDFIMNTAYETIMIIGTGTSYEIL